MAIKKSQLYASLWQSCDELRGGMDASQYKDYILTLLFMKYVSDKAANDPYPVIEVPEGGNFKDMVELRGDKEIGDKINKIIGKLAEANDLRGVIDQADFNDDSKLGRGREMQDRLSRLVAIFNDLDLSANRAEGDDLLGDAYEYLMQHFATESGKSKGQFYTPAEVSRIMAQVIGIGPETLQTQTIYDPTCGSGSLLLRAADKTPNGITVSGQEKDNATYALARMNMILHGNETAQLWSGNTLTDPYFKDADTRLKTFDFAVANPPFSDKAWTNGLDPENDIYGRFDGYGIPPTKNGDYAFLLHFIASLKSTAGKGAIILPHGVLFRGNREADIRRNLIQRGFIKGIIGLPANLFYGTGIPACILVIDKENARVRKGIFMIDASKGFHKDGNKNRLRAQDIHKIVSVFNAQTELPRYSRMVPVSEIADPANDYNLNIPRYIDSSEPEDLHDLDAHLNGGIPDRDIDALDDYWKVFPTLRDALFKGNGRPGYSDPLVEAHEVRTTILAHSEFQSYQQRVDTVFQGWREAHVDFMLNIGIDTVPREVIRTLSEDLLERFDALPLLDRYDVYQQLMDYWDETMQDDVYLIAAAGWVEASKPRGIIEDKQKKIKETADLVMKKNKYKMDLIPPALIVARYFADEQDAIEMLQTKQATAESELTEFIEEHAGEDGLLADAINASGNITASSVKERLKALTPDLTTLHETQDNDDEHDALEHCQSLLEAKSKAEKAVKDAQLTLDAQVLAHYATLTEAEIKTLVVTDKWVASIQSAIESEVQRVIQALTERVKELEERYARPLPNLVRDVEAFGAKIEAHLKSMGRIGNE
ncbi:SAM-dependent DNA methyltransferase [Candidatus Poribacteria bacterium]|nr:SAM-dependent DNA methyltransferase [Candidatus Poribacteria bacterium]MYH83311.1 SAM-dependent DNA methyltransferase [Candidatus Poribacteria bacterium]MYK93078.1 SAM-dependent DNA methyltransferase [Candidatus Poribacteria bacterium]